MAASGNVRIDRLQAELDEMAGRRPGGALSVMEVLAMAGNVLRGRTEAPPPRRGRRSPPPAPHGHAPKLPPRHRPPSRHAPPVAVVTSASLAAMAGVAWATRRVRRWWAAPSAGSASAAPALQRRQAGRASVLPPLAAVPGAGAASVGLHETGQRRPTTATPPGEITDITRNFLLGAVMPIWMVAGVADWLCHRRARIEANAGTKESLMHLLMLGEASVPVIAGMVLEITSPMLLLMFGAVALHAATALWDVSYAMKRRTVTPIEQHVHSYLEMVPVMATSFIAVLHWPELRALLGMGDRSPDWSLRRKARPLPGWVVAALLSGTVAFELLPYLEELRRTRRHADWTR